MNYKLVIFDLDNTLLNFDKMELGSLKETLTENNLEISEKLINSYRAINTELWQALEKGEYTKKEILNLRFRRLFEMYDYNTSPEEFNTSYLRNLSNHCYLYDNVIEVLDYFKNRSKLVIMTNGVKDAQYDKMKKSGLDRYFEEVIISDIVGYHKPSIEIFSYLENRIGKHIKEETIIIGDSLSSDMKGGNNFGIKTCWFNPKLLANNTDVVVDYEINSLKELFNIL